MNGSPSNRLWLRLWPRSWRRSGTPWKRRRQCWRLFVTPGSTCIGPRGALWSTTGKTRPTTRLRWLTATAGGSMGRGFRMDATGWSRSRHRRRTAMRRHELRIAQSDNVLTAYCVCGEWMGWWKIVTKNRTTGLHDSYYSPKEVSGRLMSQREKAEAHREDAQTAARGIFMGPDGFEVGWCVKHDDLARRWHDGSW